MSYESDNSYSIDLLAGRIMKKSFPTLYLQSITPLTGGVFNSTFLFTLTNEEKIVVHIAPNSAYLFSYEKYLMRAEEKINALCETHEIPVPKVILVDDRMDLIDRPYMISSYLPGKSLHQITSVPAESKTECYYAAGQAVRKMHGIVGPKFGRAAMMVYEQGFDTWFRAVYYEVQEWRKAAESAGLLPPNYYDTIDTVFRTHEDLLNRIVTPHLAHGDLWAGNILAVSDGAVCHFKAIIDTDHAIWGDPEFDFSGGMMNEWFANGYGSKLSEFEEDQDSFVRRKLYLLYYSMKQCYKYRFLHNDLRNSQRQRGYIDQLLYEFSV